MKSKEGLGSPNKLTKKRANFAKTLVIQNVKENK